MLHWTPLSLFWMFLIFFGIEVWVLSVLSNDIGGGGVFLEILLTGMLGVYFIKDQAFGRLNGKHSIEDGEGVLSLFQEVIAFLFAGFFLIMPGLITDAIGLFLAVPHLRLQFIELFEKTGGMKYTQGAEHINRMFGGGFQAGGSAGNKTQDNRQPNRQQGVIDGDYYEVEDDKKKGDS